MNEKDAQLPPDGIIRIYARAWQTTMLPWTNTYGKAVYYMACVHGGYSLGGPTAYSCYQDIYLS